MQGQLLKVWVVKDGDILGVFKHEKRARSYADTEHPHSVVEEVHAFVPAEEGRALLIRDHGKQVLPFELDTSEVEFETAYKLESFDSASMTFRSLRGRVVKIDSTSGPLSTRDGGEVGARYTLQILPGNWAKSQIAKDQFVVVGECVTGYISNPGGASVLTLGAWTLVLPKSLDKGPFVRGAEMYLLATRVP